MHINELPVDVLSKMISYKLGEPKYLRLKYSEGLKQIQKRHRQIYRGLERDVGCRLL